MNLQHTINEHISVLPEHLQMEILDFILFLKSKNPPNTRTDARIHELEQRRKKVGECLTTLAQSNPYADIEDPIAWQRELREDRILPGR
jgi:hypothetical protein